MTYPTKKNAPKPRSPLMPKPIVLLHPESASPETITRLQTAGYAVVVTATPEHVQALDYVPRASLDAITTAALKAVEQTTYAPAAFGKALCEILLAAREHPNV